MANHDISEAIRMANTGDLAYTKALEDQIAAIARRLYPEIDWDRQPVVFRISDAPYINGGIFAHQTPPILMLSRGLLEFVENEDELAFVIGHEVAHREIRKQLGLSAFDNATKGEEAMADVISIQHCLKAGYSYHGAITFFQRLEAYAREKNKQDVFGAMEALFDPHPLNGNRIVAIELNLANENLFKSGTVRDIRPTPLSGAITDRIKLAAVRHRTFLEDFLPADYESRSVGGKIRCLREALSFIDQSDEFHTASPKFKVVLDEMKKLKADPADRDALEAADRFIEAAPTFIPNEEARMMSRFRIEWNKEKYSGKLKALYDQDQGYYKDIFLPDMPQARHYRRKRPDEEVNPLFQQCYESAACIFKTDDEKSTSPAIGRFMSFANAVNSFAEAAPEAKDRAALSLLVAIDDVEDFLDEKYSLGHRLDALKKLDSLIPYKFGEGLSPSVTELAWRMGRIFYKDFLDSLPEEELRRLRYVTPCRDVTGRDDLQAQCSLLQQKIDARLARRERKAAQEAGVSFVENPEHYLFAYGEELFPGGSPDRPLERGAAMTPEASDPGKTPAKIDFSKIDFSDIDFGALAFPNAAKRTDNNKIYQRQGKFCTAITQEFMPSLRGGDVAQREKAENALWIFLSDESAGVKHWLRRNGLEDQNTKLYNLDFRSRKRKRVDDSDIYIMEHKHNRAFYPYNLNAGHPYVRLLLQALPYVEDKKKFRELLLDITDIGTFNEADLSLAFGLTAPRTVREAVERYKELIPPLKSLNRYKKDMAVQLTACTLERILEAGISITFESDEFLALSFMHGQNPDYDGNLLTADAMTALHNSITANFSEKKLRACAAAVSAAQFCDIYQFLEYRDLFPDAKTRRLFGGMLAEKITALPDAEQRPLLERLLFDCSSRRSSYDTYTVKDIGLRDFAVDAYAALLQRQHGLDDGQDAYAETVKPVIDRTITTTLPRDRVLILEKIAVALNIQEKLADHITGQLEIKKEHVLHSHLPLAGMEALLRAMEENDILREAVIDYLGDTVNGPARQKLSDAILQDQFLVNQMVGSDYFETKDKRIFLDPLGQARFEENISLLHENFASLSLDIRAAILSAMLIPGSHRLDDDRRRRTYDQAVEKVFKKVFQPRSLTGVYRKMTGHNDYAEESESFMRAFLNTAQDFEKPVILASLMTLSSSEDTGAQSLPEKAATVMSMLGPAYVKLGQAINSHPASPDDWRAATKRLKSQSGIAPRWETIRRTRQQMPAGCQILHYGPVRGDASFNTAMELTVVMEDGPEELIGLLERPHAWTRAETGFDHMNAAVKAWDHPSIQNQKETIGEMVEEAREMARVETDSAAGDRQYEKAREIYTGVSIKFPNDRSTVTINPVSSRLAGAGIRLVSKAEGVDFAALPEATYEQRAIKSKVAKAYLAFELSNILSGKGFDCDRHGQQLKINVADPDHIAITVYDFGGMDLVNPPPQARQELGRALNDITRGFLWKDPVDIMQEAITHADDADSRRYLKRVRKAWLALNDFKSFLDKRDMASVLEAALAAPVDENIGRELTIKKMPALPGFRPQKFSIDRPVIPGKHGTSISLTP